MRLAFDFALASDHVAADSVEVTGYPDLARRYRITGVPKTVVNEEFEFVGAQGEGALLRAIQDAISANSAPTPSEA